MKKAPVVSLMSIPSYGRLMAVFFYSLLVCLFLMSPRDLET